MAFQEFQLERILDRIKGLRVGEKLEGEGLDFSIFFKNDVSGSFIERYDSKIAKPSLYLLNKAPTLLYEILSENKRLTIVSSEREWLLGGGETTSDNPNGNHFLRLPLTNYIANSEARLFYNASVMLKVNSVEQSSQKPLNRAVLS